MKIFLGLMAISISVLGFFLIVRSFTVNQTVAILVLIIGMNLAAKADEIK